MFLQVDRDGLEYASSEPLIRWPFIEKKDKRIKNRKQCLSINDQYAWIWPYSCECNCGEVVLMPNGTIEKIIGKKLTYEDEPFEVN